MRFAKKTVAYALVFIFIFSARFAAYGFEDFLLLGDAPFYNGRTRVAVVTEALEALDINKRVSGVLITGKIPNVKRMENNELKQEINNRIQAVYDELASGVSENAKSLTLDFETYVSGDIVSIVMTSKEASSLINERIRSVNYDLKEEKCVSLNDILDENAEKTLSAHLTALIRQNPDEYNTDSVEITGKTAFYPDGEGALIICFDKYKIAPGRRGIVKFELLKDNYKSVAIGQEDYYLLGEYNIRMVKLLNIKEAFSYELEWDEKRSVVDVYKNKVLAASLTIGINKYQKGKSTVKPLEAAPAIVNDRTYVPISFFGEILDITAASSDGMIILSFYEE